MTDTVLSHYDAITERLLLAKGYLVAAKTTEQNAWCEHNVMMIERELVDEIEFLKNHHGVDMTPPAPMDDISDDELLAELGI